MPESWLVLIDLQHVFADPDSPWATPGFSGVLDNIGRLAAAYGPRVVNTRFVAPDEPTGAWVDYYRDWPFALEPPDAPLYDLVPEVAGLTDRVVTAPTFGKWGADLDAATEHSADLVLAGVSTDCCVLSTALSAADAGVRVRIAADACAGVSAADHERALAAMALYGPLITIHRTAELCSPERG